MTASPTFAPLAPAAPQLTLVPLTVDDLRKVESSLYQQGGRFTTQQRLFFEFLLSSPSLDEKAAAKQAGVSYRKARQWLANPAVVSAINHLMRERLKRVGIDKDALLARMVQCLDMAMGSAPVRRAVYDPALGSFHSEEVLEANLSAAGKFTEQLAKHLRMFSDEDNGRAVVNIHMDMGGALSHSARQDPHAAHEGEPSATPSAGVTLDMEPDE